MGAFPGRIPFRVPKSDEATSARSGDASRLPRNWRPASMPSVSGNEGELTQEKQRD